MVDAHKKFCKSGVIFTNGRVPKIGTLEQQKPGGPQNGIPSETGGRGTLTGGGSSPARISSDRQNFCLI